jgi:hypothetical protein
MRHLSLLALLACALLAGCEGPLRTEPLGRVDAPLIIDSHVEVARQYAPWILAGVHPTLGRHDLPTRVDFDGDLRGGDDWDHLPRFELPPTIYYAALETRTHWFLSYHIFHPRDASCVKLGLGESHENDGENLQVVVEKATGRVVLLFTQAHYFGRLHAAPGVHVETRGGESIASEVLLVDDAGKPDPAGKHAVVYVQPWGHGIYAARDATCAVTVDPEGHVVFADHGLVLHPAAPGEVPPEPSIDAGSATYALASTTAGLWPYLRDGRLIGEGGLFDGCLPYSGPRGVVQVPRYYEADRFSGIFGSDRGISPFALDTSFWTGTLGVLFFDPARRWRELVVLPGPWSTDYVDYPFTPAHP